MTILYILLGIIFLYFVLAIKMIQEGHVGVLERFGSHHKDLYPGIHFTFLGFDKLKKVVNINPQKHVLNTLDFKTTDSKNVSIVPVIDFKVINPKLCVYGVKNPMEAISLLVTEKLYFKINKTPFSDLDKDIEKISNRLTKDLKVLFVSFGIELSNISLKIVVE